MKFIAGPYVWETPSSGMIRRRWALPPGYTTSLDLRRAGDRGPQTAGQKNVAIFAGPNGTATPSGYTALGTGRLRDVTMGQARRQALQTAIGLSQTPQGNHLADVVRWLLTLGADPTGDDGLPPLALDRRGRWQCRFAGETLAIPRFRIGSPSAAALRDQLKRTLAAWRTQAQAGQMRRPIVEGGQVVRVEVDEQYHRRLLGPLLRKHGLQLADVKPDTWQASETELPHDTTIVDTFNRANSATIGTASGGFSWHEYASFATLTIASNALSEVAGTGGAARGEIDLSSPDHYAQYVSGGESLVGMLVRLSTAAAVTGYWLQIFGGTLQIDRMTAETPTTLSTTAATFAAADVVRLEAEGSTITAKINGVTIDSGTDSTYADTLRVGPLLLGQTADDFQGGDLAAAVASSGSTRHLRGPRFGSALRF